MTRKPHTKPNTAAGAEPSGKPVDQAGAEIRADAPAAIPVTDDASSSVTHSSDAPPVHQAERLVLGWPLPKDLPAVLLETAQLVVKAKPARGRRRSGRDFTRDEISIPLAELSAEQIKGIVDDPELVAVVAIDKPA